MPEAGPGTIYPQLSQMNNEQLLAWAYETVAKYSPQVTAILGTNTNADIPSLSGPIPGSGIPAVENIDIKIQAQGRLDDTPEDASTPLGHVVSGTTGKAQIVLNRNHLLQSPNPEDVLIHELVHVAQDVDKMSTSRHNEWSWFIEGVADWVTSKITGRHSYTTIQHGKGGGAIRKGYEHASPFIDWLEQKSPGVIQAVGNAIYTGDYSEEDLVNATGVSVNSLFESYRTDLGLPPRGVVGRKERIRTRNLGGFLGDTIASFSPEPVIPQVGQVGQEPNPFEIPLKGKQDAFAQPPRKTGKNQEPETSHQLRLMATDVVPGRTATAPAQGSVAQVGVQAGEARDLATSQSSTIQDLREALAVGDITQEQYNQAVGQMFDARLAQLQGDLEEQGRPEAAAEVPVGIGTSNEAVPSSGAFAPPEGVEFGRGALRPPGKLSEDDELLAGITGRPDESVTKGINRDEIPEELFELIPALMEAAKQPDAPPAIGAMLRILDFYING